MLGSNIRSLRKVKSMSINKLAEITGISLGYLSQLENGLSSNPTTDKLSKIAEALGVTLSRLVGESPFGVIENRLEELNMTVNELAEKADVPLQFILNLDDINPDEGFDGSYVEYLKRISKALSMHPLQLFKAFAQQAPPVYNGKSEDPKDVFKPVYETSDNDESDLITVYRQLSLPGKKEVNNYAGYLLTKEQQSAIRESVSIYAPIVGRSAAGAPIEYGDTLPEANMIPAPKGTDYVIGIKGDSMEPAIKDGSFVFVHSQPDIESGQIAIVEIDGGVTCKKVIKKNSHIELHSLNGKYPSRNVSGSDFRILGKVIL